MMLPQVPHQPADDGRVKVYELRDNSWFERGTGIIALERPHAEDGLEHRRIIVKSDGNSDNLLLDTEIEMRKHFQQQRDNVIVWKEDASGTHLALGFPDTKQHAMMWAHVQAILNSSTEDIGQNLSKPPAEVTSAVLNIDGNLNDMALRWAEEEWHNRRRIVQFTKRQHGASLHVNFKAIPVNKRPPDSICISCIWWQEKCDCYVTFIDIFHLLEQLVATPNRFSPEGKNRIRRGLLAFHPTTVSKDEADSEYFFKIVMAFPHPKPGGHIERNFQVFSWSTLEPALTILFDRYNANPGSYIDNVLTMKDFANYFNTLTGQRSNHVRPNNVLVPVAVASNTQAVNEPYTQKLPPLNWGTDAEEMDTFAAATDSGYASLPTHDYRKPIQNSEMNESQQLQFDGSNTFYTNLQENEDPSINDTASIYTAGPNIPASKRDAYISLLADDLLNKSLKDKPDEESLRRIRTTLPLYLKTFAMKVGSSDPALICRDVMVFVRRYRSEISNTMLGNYITETRVRSDGLDFDTTSNWHPDSDDLEDPNAALNEKPDDAMDDSHFDDLDEADRATDSLPELSDYRDFISQHPAYEWLLQCVQKELYMDEPQKEQTDIRKAILDCLPRAQRVSRSEAPQAYNLTFTADWDPGSFLQDQEYTESPEKAIDRAITITGSKTDAQAATTIQYLSQTWPLLGIHLLHAVKHGVRHTNSTSFCYYLPDRTRLIARPRGPKFELEVVGTAESIADIGEQLAWLGSALRSSPSETGVTTVGAFVSDAGINSTSEKTEGYEPTFFCNIGFDVDVVSHTDEAPNGECWHKLFCNAVIVKGYPIPRRPTSHMGLEISLDTLARLAGTRYISTFNNKLFIKGFSIMLIPTRYSNNILLWHLLCNRKGNRVSYLDGKDIFADDVSLPDLEKSRHILGWSSNVNYIVGSADANYNISSSWLTLRHQNPKLDGIFISKARVIKSYHEAAIGKREKPLWVIREPHRQRLGFLSQKYMVLWDVGSKRGWLVNGVNALLHLLRASLEINKTDELSYRFLFKPELFEEASKPYTVSAAVEVLMHSANLDMELYEEYEKDESGEKIKFRVRDRLDELFEALEKAIDYQSMIADVKKEYPESAPRKNLEGWDFKDIATSKRSTCHLRLAKLKTIGKGWVDFTRAIGAVFLFGSGFGNLMDPVPDKFTCSHWEALPADKFYLAVSAKDLNTIMECMGGNPTKKPPRLTDSFVWHPFNAALDIRCDCGTKTEAHCERAQAIWPKHKWPQDISRSLPKSTLSSLKDSGAVVFGHRTSIGWIWNDFGDPERGEPPMMDEQTDDDDDDPPDSGFGSSNVDSFQREDYHIAIICALSEELKAVRALFDETHQDLPKHESDANTYALGRLGTHRVVAACLPSGNYGTNAASKVASDLEKSFPALKWYLVVGIGGGIPSREHDIRLGDVVVSTGVIQHDMGKLLQKDSRIKSTGILERPAKSLLTAISWIQSDPSLTHDALKAHIQHIVSAQPEYHHPGDDLDTLFYAEPEHEYGQVTCENCKGPHVQRMSRLLPGPHIHYGYIASGNQVIKDAVTRDRIGAEWDVLCFEMEGAGVMETGKCLVIRGICDYADSHKNDKWHKYAAATAAAYAKFFLLQIPDLDMKNREAVRPSFSVGEESYGTKLATRPQYR